MERYKRPILLSGFTKKQPKGSIVMDARNNIPKGEASSKRSSGATKLAHNKDFCFHPSYFQLIK